MAFAEYVAALTDRQIWFDNPIMMRDARRESRRNRVFNAVLTLCVSVLALTGLGAWSLYLVLKDQGHVPEWLGGSFGAALAIFISGLHFWWVARAAQRRVDGMLMREASLDGLTSLLMLPMSRLSLLLYSSVYPWISAVCVALLFLPIYVFCVGIDGMTWAELFALYTLFGLVAVVMPGFRRPALSGNVGSTMLNHADDDPGSDLGAGGDISKRRRIRPTFSMLAMTGVVMAMIVVFSFVTGINRGLTFAGLSNYIPQSILSLMPSSVISLPYLAAKALATPFGWFELHITPLPFVVVLVLARKYLQVMRTGEYLSVGTYRDLASLTGYLPRRRMEAALNMAQAVIIVGYLWPWAVRDNGLGFLSANPVAASAGLEGFLFLSLFAACYWCIARAGLLGSWLCIFANPENDQVTRTTTWRRAALFLASPFAIVSTVFCVSTVIGGQFVVPAGSFALTQHLLAITAAGALLNFGLRRFAGPFALIGFITSAVALWGPRATQFLIYISPALGMLSQGPRDLYHLSARGMPLANAHSYMPWVVVMGGLGLALCGAAWIFAFRTRMINVDDAALCLDPTLVGREVFSDGDAERRGAGSRNDSPFSIMIVSTVMRCVDNAVLTRELRARLRSRITSVKVIGIFFCFLIASLVAGLFVPRLTYPGRGYSAGLYGIDSFTALGTQHMFADLQGCFYLGLSFAALICGYNALPRAFGLDKHKNTLSALLTTPMSTGAIVFGKAVSIIITCGAAVWAICLWTLCLSIPLAITIGRFAPIADWIEYTFNGVLGYVGIAMVMLALGSLFPDLTTVRLNGCLRLVVLWIVYIGVSLFSSIIGLVGYFYHVGEQVRWAAMTGCGIGVIALSSLITISAVGGMRKGDIDIKLAKRK